MYSYYLLHNLTKDYSNYTNFNCVIIQDYFEKSYFYRIMLYFLNFSDIFLI